MLESAGGRGGDMHCVEIVDFVYGRVNKGLWSFFAEIDFDV